MSEVATPAREAATDADRAQYAIESEVSFSAPDESTIPILLEAIRAELRADRLARQEQHEDLMVVLGDQAISLFLGSGEGTAPGKPLMSVYNRASKAVASRA